MDGAAAYLWVAIGGALGSVARFALGNAMVLLTGTSDRFALPYEVRVFVTVGICGGFTTFSSFSLQSVDLIRAGQPGRAGLYAAASVILCLAACGLGFLSAAALSNSTGPAHSL